jgi:branched-chain amino acid transport system ATP-binding protein
MSDGLRVENIESFYGDFKALHGISLALQPGQVMALIGANGAGKSTLLKSICGLVVPKTGTVSWNGKTITGLPGSHIVALGIALVPEGRRLFKSLSVEENLILGGQVARKGHWSLKTLYDLFPILQEKRKQPATLLSGGQQQMVAIGRALMSNPDLVLFDELSLGLAPIVIKDIYAHLPKITEQGVSAILVEQDVTRALGAASQFACLAEGRVSLAGTPGEHGREAIAAAYFGT